MSIQEKIITHYTGTSLTHVLTIVPDLQKLAKTEKKNGDNCSSTINALQKIMEHLLIRNVPFWVAQEFVFPAESMQIRIYKGNVRNN